MKVVYTLIPTTASVNEPIENNTTFNSRAEAETAKGDNVELFVQTIVTEDGISGYGLTILGAQRNLRKRKG